MERERSCHPQQISFPDCETDDLLDEYEQKRIPQKEEQVLDATETEGKVLYSYCLWTFINQIDAVDPGATCILYSAQYELEFMDADDATQEAMTKEAPSQLEKIILNGFKGLGLEYFFTAGEDEVRVSLLFHSGGVRNGWFQAWIIKKNTKAPQAAGRIHTDFEKGFIMAEVMDWEAWEEERSEAKVKAIGRYRQQGKTYTVQNGDIIFFKFNTPNAPKKK